MSSGSRSEAVCETRSGRALRGYGQVYSRKDRSSGGMSEPNLHTAEMIVEMLSSWVMELGAECLELAWSGLRDS